MRNDLTSWNRIPRVGHKAVTGLSDRAALLPPLGEGETRIAFGNGRSYGDVCLNPGQTALLTRGLDKFIAFDRESGIVACEAGVLLSEILDLAAPMGWFLAVTPGTRFVTVGGAIANDVHGKNHHVAGSFGDHVLEFELLRSDGRRLLCGPDQNADFFAATIGGLGLTGLVVWARLQLKPVANAFMITQSQRFASLDQFWALNAEAERDWPYTVSWIDCTSKAGRGILLSGAHAPAQGALPGWRERGMSFPVDPPISLVNGLSLRAFNLVYYRQPLARGKTLSHFTPYFYPLDSIREWNRIYGRNGFYQYQCVLPREASKDGIAAMLDAIARLGDRLLSRGAEDLRRAQRPRAAFVSTARRDARARFSQSWRDFAQIVRAAGLHHARGGRRALPGQGRPHARRDVPPQLSRLGDLLVIRRSRILLRLLAAGDTTATGDRRFMSKIVIFGASSAIAAEAARLFAARGDDLFLVARSQSKLDAQIQDLKVRTTGSSAVIASAVADLADATRHDALLDEATRALGGLDVVLVAHGSLPDQKACEASVEQTLAEINTNALSVISIATLAANRFEPQKKGVIAVIGSVAGDRGRQSNYVYGAAKGMVAIFLEGLRNRLAKSGVAVVTIKPGFVDTPMTAQFEKKGPLWAQPQDVAAGIVKAIDRRADVVYLPGFWRLIMLVIRHIPEFIFKKLSL